MKVETQREMVTVTRTVTITLSADQATAITASLYVLLINDPRHAQLRTLYERLRKQNL